MKRRPTIYSHTFGSEQIALKFGVVEESLVAVTVTVTAIQRASQQREAQPTFLPTGAPSCWNNA